MNLSFEVKKSARIDEAYRNESAANLENLKMQLVNPGYEMAERPFFNYGPIQGELFVNGVSPRDVKQGAIGDCYFLASLAGLADTHPESIRNAVHDNADGTYTVRFYKDKKPQFVTVNNILLHDRSGNPLYGRSTDSKELWVAVMEKAFARWSSIDEKRPVSYETIANGGDPARAIQALTGLRTQRVKNGQTTEDELYQHLLAAARDHRPVVAATGRHEKAKGNGLSANHAYTVLGVAEENGRRYVELRNPWANHEWKLEGADRVDDGVFQMPLKDFKALFVETIMAK